MIADIDLDSARASERLLNEMGIKASSVHVNVSEPDSVSSMTEYVLSTCGQIDILVHSAGIGVEKPFLTTSLEEWNRILRVDLTGTFLCCQSVAKHMVQRRYGRIVNIASTAAIRGGTGRAAYGAAKGGVVTLTKVIAIELAGYGVTANALAPGAIETELVRRMHAPETRRVYTDAIPMDRYGTAEETAAVAAFLAGPEAAYVTGQVVGVDGGFLAAGVLKKPEGNPQNRE